jgi:hypothetical protein
MADPRRACSRAPHPPQEPFDELYYLRNVRDSETASSLTESLEGRRESVYRRSRRRGMSGAFC